MEANLNHVRPLDGEAVLRSRKAVAEAIMTGVNGVAQQLDDDADMQASEYDAGMFLAGIDSLASMIAALSDDPTVRMRLTVIATQKLRMLVKGLSQ